MKFMGVHDGHSRRAMLIKLNTFGITLTSLPIKLISAYESRQLHNGPGIINVAVTPINAPN